ncbi:MAG: hypothetical protein ACREU8_07990, partial [Gammaproteobacteria bacterium]
MKSPIIMPQAKSPPMTPMKMMAAAKPLVVLFLMYPARGGIHNARDNPSVTTEPFGIPTRIGSPQRVFRLLAIRYIRLYISLRRTEGRG